MKRFLLSLALLLVTGVAFAQPAPAGSALPAAGSTDPSGAIVVTAQGSRSLFKIAVAPPPGDKAMSDLVVDVANKDYQLSSIFDVLDAKTFSGNLEKEGLSIDPPAWQRIGAEGVVKGNTAMRGSQVHLELRLYVVSRGATEVLKKEYDVAPNAMRGAIHQFDNEVVKYFTSREGSFGTRLVYTATTAHGQRGIFSIESDGYGLTRLQAAATVALAPAFGPGGIYYSAGLPDGSYQLYKVGASTPVFKSAGMVFGAAFGGNTMAAVISENGNSDIWKGQADGTGLTKITKGGLNTHPAFGPSGQLAYVSNAGGNPQIYVDGKRVSYRGIYNMAPVWCNDPDGAKILFMGRDGSTWDIFSVDASGGNMKRLTQGQGSNTYPACSPDGRMVAFFSTRGGLYISNTQGGNQQKIGSVIGEALRWEGN